jgi:trk system potassium uptake protein TrkA
MYAKNRKIPQVITRTEYLDEFDITSQMSLGSLICPKNLCCNNIVRYVRALQNQSGAATTVHIIADGHAEALEFVVNPSTKHCGEPLKKLPLRKGILLVGISNGSKTEIPNGDSFFSVGDSVVVVASGDTVIHQLNDIFA